MTEGQTGTCGSQTRPCKGCGPPSGLPQRQQGQNLIPSEQRTTIVSFTCLFSYLSFSGMFFLLPVSFFSIFLFVFLFLVYFPIFYFLIMNTYLFIYVSIQKTFKVSNKKFMCYEINVSAQKRVYMFQISMLRTKSTFEQF